MIRPLTIVAAALVVFLGFSLFTLKYEVQSLEEELVHVNRQAAEDQERIHVLKAELSMMTQPERLSDLAQRHLTLEPVTAAHVGSYDTLPLRSDRPPADSADASVAKLLQAMQASAPTQTARLAPVRVSATAKRGALR